MGAVDDLQSVLAGLATLRASENIALLPEFLALRVQPILTWSFIFLNAQFHADSVTEFLAVASHFTVLTSGVSPWMRTSRRSPLSIGPTPLGVPVMITSPGSSVMLVEMKLTSW